MPGPPPPPTSANMTIKRPVKTVHRLPTLPIQAWWREKTYFYPQSINMIIPNNNKFIKYLHHRLAICVYGEKQYF
jgi:hypothetical protein